MATREEFKPLMDGMPDKALPFIQETLQRWPPQRSVAARLIARLSEGSHFELNGERSYRRRDDLHDR